MYTPHPHHTLPFTYNKCLLISAEHQALYLSISACITNAIPQPALYYPQFIREEVTTISECPLYAKCFKPIIPWRVYLCSSIYTHFTDVRKLSPKEVKWGSQGATKDSSPVRCAPSWCLLAVLLLLPPQCTTSSPPNTHRFTRLRKQPASKSPDSLTQHSGFVLYV